MVTIKDVATESKVSITTVSLVLRGGPSSRRISDDTRKRICEVANRLGYRPNLFARSLRSNRSHSLGVVVFDITDPYCVQILRGIENHLRSIGYFPVLTDLQNDRAQFQRSLSELQERRVEGIIAIANPSYLDASLLTEISNHNMPTVVIGRDMTGSSISSVSVDNESGTRLAIQHLYDLGHSKIAVIKGPKSLVDSSQRFHGLESFARERRLKFDPKLILEAKGRNTTYAEGFQLTKELLARGREFTALVAFDDLTACAAIRALSEAGVIVPRDCSVVGFDDIPYSAFYNPPLTTIDQQLEMQGALGAEIVEQLISASLEARSVEPKHRKVSPRIVLRDSTSAPLRR